MIGNGESPVDGPPQAQAASKAENRENEREGSSSGSDTSQCKGDNGDCVWPFIFKGVTYNQGECTSVYDTKPWCSTSTDASNNHLGSGISHCNSFCEDVSKGPRGCRAESGEECVWPFIHRGVTHVNGECTMVSSRTGKPWCSVKTDENNVHVGNQGHWRDCNSNCLERSQRNK